MSVPFYYQYMNEAETMGNPKVFNVDDSPIARYFKKYLLQEAMSVYQWTLPETWSRGYFLYTLFCQGRVAIVRTNKYGVIPQHCGLLGFNVMYEPTNALITNPLLTGILEPLIGKECTIIKLQDNYSGIMDIVSVYSDLMTLAVQSAGVNFINSKLAYVFTASNQKAADSFKAMFDDIANGKPCTVIDRDLQNKDGTDAWQAFSQNLKQNYIAGDVLSDLRKLKEMFLTEIGIPNANTDKKERLIKDEVNANNFETLSKAAQWLEQMQKSCKETEKMFNIKLSVNWRETPGGGNDGRNNNNPRPV